MTSERDGTMTERTLGVARRLLARSRRRPSPGVQRALLVLAAVAFLGGAVVSARALDLRLADLEWVPLVVAGLVLVPLTVVTNAEEYRISARVLGHHVAHRDALRVTLWATAANLLPLPGAFVVRTQALRSAGSDTRAAASATAIVGIGWIGVSVVLAGLLLLPTGRLVFGAAATVAGIAVLAVATVWMRVQVGEGRVAGLTAWLLAVETAAVGVNAGRLVLVMTGLGISTDLPSAFVLAVSSSLASATGILPGGFGVREGIAAALSPLVGLTPAAGFLAVAANRVLGLIVLAPLSGAAALAMDTPTTPDAEGDAP